MAGKKSSGKVKSADSRHLIVPVPEAEAKSSPSLPYKDAPELHLVVREYLESLRNIFETAKIVLPHLATWLQQEVKKTEAKIDAHLPEGHDEEDALDLTFDNARDFVDFITALNKWDRLQEDNSIPLLSRSLFMQVFCVFDAFVGRLLKQIYLKNDDLLRGISREISLIDLLGFKDIESASRAMLEKEIDSFRRDSYIDQFSQLERKFGLPLKKFPEWSQFVEFSQRRNLLAHNDGIVNDQYIAICKREGYELPETHVVGYQLSVSPDDLASVLRVMSKVGYMLCHTLWSKVFPGEIVEVHESLNQILYQCLEDKRWGTASNLGDFALTEPMKKDLADIDLRLRVINTAIAKKFSGRKKDSDALLKSLDWTASYRDFKLALLILSDKFDEAIQLIREIGKSGELLRQEAYHQWPLFEEFRKREDFYAIYEEIYGEPYEADSADKLAARMASDAKKIRGMGQRANRPSSAKKKSKKSASTPIAKRGSG